MTKLSVISFTKNGLELSRKILCCQSRIPMIHDVLLYTKWSGFLQENNEYAMVQYCSDTIGAWAGAKMRENHALLFIGACGIAVRAIAPYVADKLCDSPVLVMDELGVHVIPVLSGHVGGANELAVCLGDILEAHPVITTATDINQRFAVDLFAKKNGLSIMNREGIARISSAVLNGKTITISMETGHLKDVEKNGAWMLKNGMRRVPYPPEEEPDILITSEPEYCAAKLLLKPRIYALGMGCRAGKKFPEMAGLVSKTLEGQGIALKEVFVLASIDRKKEEACFLEWSRKNRIPFQTFSTEALQSVPGDFQDSGFVEAQVGVGNVCERAAMIACGKRGELVLSKHSENGMTIAIAKRDWSVSFL